MQDTDKVRISLLSFMAYSNIEASLKVCKQEISENNSNNNSKNALFSYSLLLSHLVLHKSITMGENGGITQNKTSATWKNSEIWNLCPSAEWNLLKCSLKQLHGDGLVRLAFVDSELFL